MTNKDNVRRSIMLTSDMHTRISNLASEYKMTADDVVEGLFEIVDEAKLRKILEKLKTQRTAAKKVAIQRRRKLTEAAETLSPDDFDELMKMIEERA